MRRLALCCVGIACWGCESDGKGPDDSNGAGSGGTTASGGARASGGVTGGTLASGGRSSSGGANSSGGSTPTAGRGGRASGGATSSSGGESAAGAGGEDSAAGGTTSGGAQSQAPIAEQFPGDIGIANHDAVLFHDDFEGGWGRWDAPDSDTQYLHIETDAGVAHAGERYLRSTVTLNDLEADEYISAAPYYAFDRRVDSLYWRFYVRFPVVAPNPHHWIRVEAGNEDYGSSGLANTVPPGDEGFWFDFDITNDDVFNFYAYWYEMRSGRCNDGSATPGCAGDQGTTYYYGNVFQPADQTAFQRDAWVCVELGAGVNTVGRNDGWLAFWIDDTEVGRYAPGEPVGTWLRSSFHEGGCDFSACTDPAPFEGFDFRSAPDVQFKRIILDAYYERGSNADKRAELEERGLTLADEQTIYYDDIVVATTRIGCRR